MAELSHEDWLESANDAFHISLVAPLKSGLKTLAVFQPSFTYSIFGEEEQIFGYKGLNVNLRFRANDMRPHLKVSYREKYKRADREPDEIKDILDEGNHLPKVAYVSAKDFEESSKQISDDWSPPGTLHKTIATADSTYEIWRASFEDPAVQQLNSRIQIFSKLFIDGASYIGQDFESDSAEQDFSDANRWTFFLLYQKRQHVDDPNKHSYVFVGYSTVYRFFCYRPQTPSQSPTSEWELPKDENFDLRKLPCRTRISQFIILPPFQGKGNGVRLYETIFEYYYNQPTTFELTVEAPNEAFDDLRDVCDLAFLRKNADFNKLQINTSVEVPKKGLVPKLITGNENIEAIRLEAKIASRQFYRVLEMHLMSQLPDSVRPSMDMDDNVEATKAEQRQLKLWQLVVKQRVYRKNRDALSELELPERIDKLQETIQSIELEYARILAAHDRTVKHLAGASTQEGKRKLEESNGEGPSKRARVEDADDA